MAFELEELNESGLVRLQQSANEKQRLLFERRNYFNLNPGLMWATDATSGSFIFRGPKIDIRSIYTTLFFFFEDQLIEVDVRGYSGAPVLVRAAKPLVDAGRFRQLFAEAVSVHGFNGWPDREPSPVIHFSIEG